MILVVKNVKGQKISCSWERHQNKKLIGKQIGTSSKREHAKSKCKAQQDKCTGIIEYGPNDFAVSRNFIKARWYNSESLSSMVAGISPTRSGPESSQKKRARLFNFGPNDPDQGVDE